MKNETILEIVNSGGSSLRVDRAGGVIRGVRVLGLISKNGREYPRATVARAAGLYEGVRVNVNHPKGTPSGSRDYQDRLGQLRNVTADGSGLRGDLHANPKHTLFEQLAWDAENSPESVGLSHNVEARTSRRDGKTIVEEITRVVSVDLVADPATTRGLFEHTEDTSPEPVKVENAADFTAAITGGVTAAERRAVSEALGEPTSESNAAFLETIGGPAEQGNVNDFIQAIT
jgi:hypothetical protein